MTQSAVVAERSPSMVPGTMEYTSKPRVTRPVPHEPSGCCELLRNATPFSIAWAICSGWLLAGCVAGADACEGWVVDVPMTDDFCADLQPPINTAAKIKAPQPNLR